MLPIGTLVFLKEGTRKIMILNRGPIIEIDGVQSMFDYSGCFYPQGLVPDNVFYFNEENIDQIVFQGYNDGEEERFQQIFADWIKEHQDEFHKVKVDKPLS